MKRRFKINFNIIHVLLLSLFLFSTILTCRTWLLWLGAITPLDKKENVLSLNNINYHPTANKTSPTEYFVQTPSSEQVVSIHLKFKVDRLNGYMNLFQTAPLNTGIRVELSPKGELAVITAHKERERFVGAQLSPKVPIGEWHELALTIWKHHLLKASIDSISVVSILDSNIDFKLSDIKVGTGFVPARPFLGQIEQFNLSADQINKDRRNIVNHYVNSMAFFSLILALYCFIRLCHSKMSSATKVEFFSIAILFGFVAAVTFHYIITYYWGALSPKNSFLFSVIGGQFGDLKILLIQDIFFAPYIYKYIPGLYFPFNFVLIYPLTKINVNLAIILYSLVISVGIFYFIKLYLPSPWNSTSEKSNNYKNIFIIGILNFPFLFCLERANLESLLFIFLAFAFYFYQQKKFFISSLLVALASAMKLYPLFFITFFLAEKRYKESICIIGLTLALSLVSLCLLHPGFTENLHAWLGSLAKLQNNIMLNSNLDLNYNSGLWGMIKAIALLKQKDTAYLSHLFKWYHLGVFISMLVITYCIIFIETIAWRRLALITLAIILFPEMSNDYKLIHLLLPLVFFLNAKPRRTDLLYAILFVLLLIPTNYYWFNFDISISNFIHPIAMICITLGILLEGIYHRVRINVSPTEAIDSASHSMH